MWVKSVSKQKYSFFWFIRTVQFDILIEICDSPMNFVVEFIGDSSPLKTMLFQSMNIFFGRIIHLYSYFIFAHVYLFLFYWITNHYEFLWCLCSEECLHVIVWYLELFYLDWFFSIRLGFAFINANLLFNRMNFLFNEEIFEIFCI